MNPPLKHSSESNTAAPGSPHQHSDDSPELSQARLNAQKSTEQFERALDELRDRIVGTSQSFQSAIEAAKQPMKAAEQYVVDQLRIAEDHLDETLGRAENRVNQLIRRSADEGIQTAEQLIEKIRLSADLGLRLADEKPLTTWFTVFLGGCLLGALALRGGPKQI